MEAGLITLVIAGVLLLAIGLPLFIVSAVRRAIRRDLALVESEGIVLDSGRVRLTIRLLGFRAPSIYVGSGVRAGPGRLVLTRRRLCTIPIARKYASVADVALTDLARFQVGTEEGRLLLRTHDPPNASGRVDLVVSVPDVETWVKALTDVGARPLVGAAT